MGAARWLVFVLCLTLLAAGAARVGADASQIDKEVKELTAKFLSAYEKKDLAQVMALFAKDSNVVVIDNSPGGRHVGAAEIENAFEREFAETAKVTMKSEWTSVGKQGNVAWFSSELTAKMTSPEENLTIPIRWSGVLSKREGKWLIVMTHFSFISPDEEGPKPKDGEVPKPK